MKDKVQTPNGRFVLPTNGQVPWDTEVPGTIRYSMHFLIIDKVNVQIYMYCAEKKDEP